MKYLLLITSLLSLAMPSMADNLDYKIKNDRFITSEGDIPNGCFGQLMTELNGDNSIAAIYINRADLRGCVTANYPFPDGESNEISYQIIERLKNDSYKLEVCEVVHGSMGASCDNILVKFVNRDYLIDGKIKQVLSLEKLGQF
ncbi:hypothetical protein A9Q74_06440 [Colwellia sp. 39_35_sub15_T18]|nr:hypothetical protein A9Q74_06440 [Colwellia sp. 39_35_sub15_T18]